MRNTILHTPTNNLKESIDFYTKLGFNYLPLNEKHYVFDGSITIEINADRYARAGVKIYRESWLKEIERLREFTPVAIIGDGFMLSDSTGVRIYLIEKESGIDFPDDEGVQSTLGNFAGLSLEGITVKQAYKVWKEIGFDITMGSEDESWMGSENKDGLSISFMKSNTCPHLFFNPSMTFFNGKNNLEVIAKIRNLEIPITEEITYFNKENIVDNIIIRDPGGFGFFLFSD